MPETTTTSIGPWTITQTAGFAFAEISHETRGYVASRRINAGETLQDALSDWIEEFAS